MGRDTILRCDGLVRRFGDRTAVDDVSFEIGRGETYGLLGPNGSGKTTTISMLCGILVANEGRVEVAGEPITPAAIEAKRAIGLVPQEIALYQDLTAAENLRFFGRLQGLRSKQLGLRIDEVLDVVALRDRANDRVDEFSGGMKRRVNIAVGLLHQPQLLVLDEPTVGVDPQSRNQILASVESLGTAGMAVLYTTHYMEEAERLCDRIGILDQGRMIAEGTQAALVSRIGENDLIIIEGQHDPSVLDWCRTVSAVVHAEQTGRGIEITSTNGTRSIGPLLTSFEDHGIDVPGLQLREPNLEAVFLELTGRALRD